MTAGRSRKSKTTLLLATALIAGSGLAVSALGQGSETIYTRGDAGAGESLYNSTCLSCHGPAGASRIPQQPILSAQHPAYTHAQLAAYKSGARADPVMLGMSANLSDQDMADLAVYLHQQAPVVAGATDKGLAEQGRRIYRGGVAQTGTPACLGCHGPAGKGIPPTYPRLSGQYAEYVTTTLLAYRNGTRVNEVMQSVVSRLSEDQINALAEYISGLH